MPNINSAYFVYNAKIGGGGGQGPFPADKMISLVHLCTCMVKLMEH